MQTMSPTPVHVYLTYDCDRNVQHIICGGDATNGFLKYIREDTAYVKQQGLNANLWMAHYFFRDKRHIPDFSRSDLKEYMNKIAAAAERHAGKCLHSISMKDFLFCNEHGIIPLTPQAETSQLVQHEDYPGTDNSIDSEICQPNLVLPEYRAYQALSSHHGVLIFSNSEGGDRQRNMYESYIEHNYFTSANPGGALNYYEVIADPSKMTEKIDKLQFNDLPNSIKEAFADETILSQGRRVKTIYLERTIENYLAFCKRNDPKTKGKRLTDLSFGEIWNRLTDIANPGHERTQCVENRVLPDKRTELTFKARF